MIQIFTSGNTPQWPKAPIYCSGDFTTAVSSSVVSWVLHDAHIGGIEVWPEQPL